MIRTMLLVTAILATAIAVLSLPGRHVWAAEDPIDTMADQIDSLIEARLRAEGYEPGELCRDEVFLRRVYLDLAGVLPTVADVRAFLKDDSPDKRIVCVDRLLTSPRYATHMASSWRNVMLPRSFDREQLNNAAGLQNWLRNQFVKNLRYDNLVAEFLVATGDGTSGPALYYTSLEMKPEKLAASSARIFLGLQIQCAECHDHPSDHWTQRDFWAYAAFFSQLQEPSEGMVNMRVVDRDEGEVLLPDTEEVIGPRFPGSSVESDSEFGTRRSQLAIWMASRDNPYLARAAVNGAWAQLFGRGLVHPVDDLGQNNPASHPELLKQLATYFTKNRFDQRLMMRTLVRTKAYQRSSELTDPAIPDFLFGRMLVKTLNSEQLYDCVTRAAGTEVVTSGMVQDPFLEPRRLAFVSRMHRQTRDATQYQVGLPHALLLMNGPEIQAATSPQQSRLIRGLAAPWFSDEQRIETLFLATMSRFPNEDERREVQAALNSVPLEERQAALADVLWALLNSGEFALNH
ncbi:MAG: DUF1549 and DUF1553 domain-containing protein [Pirellulaceae bacterium]